MNMDEVVKEIENLIDRFAKELSEEEYLEALSEMTDRSANAYNVRQEEIGEA